MTCDLWPFKTGSVVRLRRESNAGPLTHKASPNQPAENFGCPNSDKSQFSLFPFRGFIECAKREV